MNKRKAQLAKAINAAFGSMDAMKEQFGTAAAGVFGSGWAWLGCTPDGKLAITSTPNQGKKFVRIFLRFYKKEFSRRLCVVMQRSNSY